MSTFDHDDDIRRQEADELHGHAGGWFDQPLDWALLDAEQRTLALQGYPHNKPNNHNNQENP